MIVSDIMSTNVIHVTPEDSVENAARLLSQHNIGALPVCTPEGNLRGIVTDRDITLRCVAADFQASSTQVRGIMSKSPITVEARADIREAAKLMGDHQVRRLPVIDQGKLVGIVSLGDLAKNAAADMEAAKALSNISENNSIY